MARFTRFLPGFCMLAIIVLLSGCAGSKPSSKVPDTAFLNELFTRYPGNYGEVFQSPDKFRLQVVYTRIDRRRNNQPIFTDYHFNVSPRQYFYPASTVKLPVALLALQKLNELTVGTLPAETPMITEANRPWESPVYNDPLDHRGIPSIANYIKKIFLVSDNDAFNRLYEFCGQDYINTALAYMGYDSSEIIHRLSIPLTAEQNRYSNTVRFMNDSGRVVRSVDGERSNWVRYNRDESLGSGYLSNGKHIQGPFDFSSKNRLLLTDLHSMLKSLVFPGAVAEQQQFRLRPADRQLVLKYMSEYPSESRFPFYDPSEIWDTYCKFLFYGSEKQPPRKNIRIFNKVGDAYGFLTDVAYIVDLAKNVEFMVSATVYCNSDGVFNDDKYDYDSLGLPLLKHIGEVLYNYEVSRPRKRSPDLEAFRFNYQDPADGQAGH